MISVHNVDNAIQLKNRYSVDNYQGKQLYYPLEREVSIGYQLEPAS